SSTYLILRTDELYLSFFFSSRRRHTRWPRDWSSDVCSSDLVHQALPVARFLGAHAVEHGGGGGKILAKTFGKIGVDALILFLERDGKSKDLAFRKAVKVAHVRLLSVGYVARAPAIRPPATRHKSPRRR